VVGGDGGPSGTGLMTRMIGLGVGEAGQSTSHGDTVATGGGDVGGKHNHHRSGSHVARVLGAARTLTGLGGKP